jgi:hypothetical protein
LLLMRTFSCSMSTTSQSHGKACLAELECAGWIQQGLSVQTDEKANRVLIASRIPIAPLPLTTLGGRSTGPKTEAGRQRSGSNNLVHGRETREARTERSLAMARLAVLEEVGHELEFIGRKRTCGRKPDRMAEAHQELQALLKVHLNGGKLFFIFSAN